MAFPILSVSRYVPYILNLLSNIVKDVRGWEICMNINLSWRFDACEASEAIAAILDSMQGMSLPNIHKVK